MTNELVPVDLNQYPVLQGNGNFSSVIAANLAGEEVSELDLPRILLPAQGGTTWMVPSPGGEEPLKELVGIVLHTSRQRNLWPSTTPEGNLPLCTTKDCRTGMGDPGGECGTFKHPICPFAKPGSALGADGEPRKGARCEESRLLFLLRPKQNLPDVIKAPPGSLKGLRQWLTTLPLLLPSYRCGFSLKTVGEGKLKYSVIVPRVIDQLNENQAMQIIEYANALTATFQATSIRQDDNEIEEV